MNARRVRRLQLRAPDDALRARGRWLIEDALHTASFDAGARLLLIRRLALPRIDPQASPASLALRVEHSARQATTQALHASHASAALARAVFFDTPQQAAVLLLQQLLRGTRPSAWFWTRAVPAWSPAKPTPQAFVAVLAALLAEPPGIVAAAQWLAALVDSGRAVALRTLLSEPQALVLLQRCAWRTSVDALGAEPLSLPPQQAAWLVQLRAEHVGDALPRLCASLLSIAVVPARAADPRLPQRVAATLAALPMRAIEAEVPAATTSPRMQMSPQAVGALDHGTGISVASPDAVIQQCAENASPPAANAATPAAHAAAPLDDLALFGASAGDSAYAGLVFLLPALTQLGFERWLTARPAMRDTRLAERIVLCACDVLRVPGEDALRTLLNIDDTLPIADAAPSVRQCRAHALGWLRALRHHLRARAGLRLRTLALRRGRIVATRTHLDLIFAPGDVDLRVRRAGLDLDCGWLPWLGRIVSFHYQREMR